MGASAVWEAVFGNRLEARTIAQATLALARGRDTDYGPAFALALTMNSGQAQQIADQFEKQFPEDTSVRFHYLPALRAIVALNEGDPAKAVELTEIAVPYELAVPGTSFYGLFGSLYPVYVRGLAYLKAGRGAEAAAEFQKIIDHPGLMLADPVGAVARLQLGRAFAISGNRPNAKAAYEDFLTLWKDADPDIPLLKQAKAEYAGLSL